MKNNVYPCKPQFCYIQMGLRGSKLYMPVFVIQKLSPLYQMVDALIVGIKQVLVLYLRTALNEGNVEAVHTLILPIAIPMRNCCGSCVYFVVSSETNENTFISNLQFSSWA